MNPHSTDMAAAGRQGHAGGGSSSHNSGAVDRHLFGTDGIRGVAGEFPMDRATACAVGRALGSFVSQEHREPAVVIGTDTRESGGWLAPCVAAGLIQQGVRPRFAGVLTTPGVAYLARTGPFAAGVMISASHNPYQDNGIKVLSHTGYKYPDATEHQLEQGLYAVLQAGSDITPARLDPDESLPRQYEDYLASTMPGTLRGLSLVVDCANGAASALAPALFRRLGADVHAICCHPDGRNINLDCGSLHIAGLREETVRHRADLGVAFDGDADRAIFVTRSGKVVDGDGVLLIAARFLRARGVLSGDGQQPCVVATVMSNLGLEQALAAEGIRLLRTPVGDKYVLEEMLRAGAVLGGEQSGHVIFLHQATTGDGILTALRVLEAMLAAGADLETLTAGMNLYPQILLNVRLQRKLSLSDMPAVQEEIRVAEEALATSGRVLVRPSGTEPLFRVMVEGQDRNQVERYANCIAQAIAREVNGAGP